MDDVVPKARIVKESVETTIHRLEIFVSRMERRYECTSDVMERDVREGRARETAEVCKWLGNYHVLCELKR